MTDASSKSVRKATMENITDRDFYLPEEQKTQEQITSTLSPSGTNIIFENPSEGSTFFVNVIPEVDSSKRKIICYSNDKRVGPKFLGEPTSKHVIASFRGWGAKPKHVGVLTDFLDGRLRTTSIEKENKLGVSVNQRGVGGSYQRRKKEATEK